jgi:negative regulator of flagellin synthesis FlgM
MAIESVSNNKATSLPPSKPAAKGSVDSTAKTSAVSSSGDTVSLTSTAQSMQAASGQSSETPINEQRVASIKAALTAGAFPFNPDRIAKKLLDFDQQLPNTS